MDNVNAKSQGTYQSNLQKGIRLAVTNGFGYNGINPERRSYDNSKLDKRINVQAHLARMDGEPFPSELEDMMAADDLNTVCDLEIVKKQQRVTGVTANYNSAEGRVIWPTIEGAQIGFQMTSSPP